MSKCVCSSLQKCEYCDPHLIELREKAEVYDKITSALENYPLDEPKYQQFTNVEDIASFIERLRCWGREGWTAYKTSNAEGIFCMLKCENNKLKLEHRVEELECAINNCLDAEGWEMRDGDNLDYLKEVMNHED